MSGVDPRIWGIQTCLITNSGNNKTANSKEQGLEGYFWDSGFPGNSKCLDSKRDLSATQEAGFIKICARGEGFLAFSVGNLGNHDNSNSNI